MLDYYELQFASDPLYVRNMVRSLLEFVDSHSPSIQVRDDLKLVFSELLYNAVIHGNKENRDKSVFVKLKTSNGCLFAEIQDEGPGFDYRYVLEYAKTEEALLSQHGRGMVLACALTDKLIFNETGNHIWFEKRLK